MNLQGSLAKFLKTGAIFYQKRADCFSHNQIVRDAWLRLAEDMDVQASSLKSLPHAFWKEIQPDQDDLIEKVAKGFPIKRNSQPCEAVSLQESIGQSLLLEEPVVLSIHAPLVRKLRSVWSNRNLDFYVIVKSHVTGLMRLVQTYSGDPALIQRAASLLENFEREAQEPEFVVVEKVARKGRAQKHGVAPAARPKQRTARKPSRKASRRPLAGRQRPVTKRAKPLVRKIRISSRRASR
jgi:hypothetical protein